MAPPVPRLVLHVSMGLLMAAVLSACSPGPAPARPDVLLITIDTLRADFVHSYGQGPPVTPEIDALAARGALFETAIAASTATAPSHASIMSSRYVREHSVGAVNGATRLEGVQTLAERFRQAGYETAAFVSNVVLKARSGLDQGFDLYDDELPEAEANRGMIFERLAVETTDRVLAWLDQPREAPFFVWVHLQDPHGPYTPGAPWSELAPELPLRTDIELPVLGGNSGRGGIPHYQALPGVRRGARYAGLYAGEVALTDHEVGRLVAAAEAASRSGLVIALTADHGESLDEEGFFFQHGHATTPEQARVPLVLVAPGVAPRRIAGVVSHVDLAPTLLELAGLEPLGGASGISLVPAMRDGVGLPARAVLTDIGRELSAYDDTGFWTVHLDGRELDWQRRERQDDGFHKTDGPELPDEIRAYLAREVETVPAHAMSEQDLERLRALGYLPPRSP
jgi:arylsulfatase A-like enzyme